MRTIVSTFALALLLLALAFSGPAWRSMALSETTMAELCLDGVVQVVRLGRDGQPVTPNQDCDQGHACCIIASDPTVPDVFPDGTATFLEHLALPHEKSAPPLRIAFLFADPRGPPAAWIGQIDQTEILS